ncbi:MAG: hypothetical protein ACRC9O_03230 [Plesiomonas sp.]|uniref:hypothetical protein n=1 Tax=Plesiomonas sp. TaxID=2486279 RepID=UPI003F2D2D32
MAKSDIRYYLNGIRISRKYVSATDGHIAIRMSHGCNVRSEVTLLIKEKIPAKAHMTKIHLLGRGSYVEHTNSHGVVISISPAEIIDGKYVDIDAVFLKAKEAPVGTSIPHLNAKLLKLAGKAIDQSGSRLVPITLKIPETNEKPVLIYTDSELVNHDMGDPELVIMPVKMSDDK